jgi:PAS domain S-box-containing protein
MDLRSVYVGLPIIAAFTFLILALLTWQHRQTVGAPSFIGLCIALAVWAAGGGLEHASTELPVALFWAKFKYLGAVFVPTLWFVIALRYTGRDRWLTPRNAALLSIPPLLSLAMVLTTEWHGLYWSSYRMTETQSGMLFLTTRGTGYWFNGAYNYLLMFIGTVLLIRMALRTLRLYRLQLIVLIVGCLVPWIANLSFLLRIVPLPGIDLTSVAFVFTAVGIVVGVLRLKMLDIVPVARDALIENMSDGVIVIDVESRVIDINPTVERLIGRKAHEVLGQPVDVVFSRYKDIMLRYGNNLETQAEVALEQGGNKQYFDLRVTPLFDGRGRFQGRFAVYRDITKRVVLDEENARLNQILQAKLAELQALYDKVSRLEQLKSDMINMAAHDLSNPLTTILNSICMLRDELEGSLNSWQHTYLDSAQRAVEQMTRITKDILSLKRIEQAAEKMETVDIARLVADVFEACQDQAQQKHQHYDLALTKTGIMVNGDPIQLREAMTNLIVNALKYTPENGRVSVWLAMVDDRAVFQVQDTGYGIPVDQQDKLFRPFSRIKNRETQNIDGTGLGLYLVKNILERHGGNLRFQSVYGQGSTFGFELPVFKAIPASSD